MIQSLQDYKAYIAADREANQINGSMYSRVSVTWKYLKILRKAEYYNNCKKGLFGRLLSYAYKYKLYKISVRSGITIPVNTFGKGLYLPHYGSIVVNHTARFGDFCVVQNGVNVSESVGGGILSIWVQEQR